MSTKAWAYRGKSRDKRHKAPLALQFNESYHRPDHGAIQARSCSGFGALSHITWWIVTRLPGEGYRDLWNRPPLGSDRSLGVSEADHRMIVDVDAYSQLHLMAPRR